MCNINIVKRDGSKEKLDLDKINKVVLGACAGVANVSASEILLKAKLHFVDGMTSARIQEIIIKAATEMVTATTPEYATPAARLQMYDLRKKVYGQYKPCSFSELYKKNVELGKYDKEVLEIYDESEWAYFDSLINHRRDKTFSLAACGQLLDKYLLKDKGTGQYFETPQMMYMAIAITLHGYHSNKEYRLEQIKKFYEGASTFSFSLPTPIMAGVRTPTRQFSSCVLIKCGDTLDSINATATAITNYVSKKAGIGLDHGAIRGEGASIRNGEMTHTGVIPFLKYHTAALKSCSQGGVRGGAGTTYYPFWHIEFENLIVLKNNKGVEENRERRLDYGLQMNGALFELYMNDEFVYLFSPEDVPDLYDSFYSGDNELFRKEYMYAIWMAESGKIRYKKIKATQLLNTFAMERSETGRIYVAFVDNINKQSPFDTDTYPIYQSNLCAEIALPTKSFESENDESGRIALCTLASFNMSKYVDILWDEEARKVFWEDCAALVQGLDGLLGYQDYPMIQAKISTDEFRTLGVGIVNYADFHAKLGVVYGEKLALEYTNRWMEMLAYGLTKASADLAERYGACTKSSSTCYGQGKFPWELRNKNIDKIVSNKPFLEKEWEELRKQLLTTGIRNATLMAIAPTESSAQVLNATNGVEMPKAKVSVKASKSGLFNQVVPNPDRQYSYLWEQKSPVPYLTSCAVCQKWVDQSISTNTFYNPENYETGKIPKEDIIGDIYEFYKLGGKTLYYSNFHDGSDDSDDNKEVCETCVV
ncbi:ribonucleotide reductase large subunit [Vibrio phage 1.121.O._10N.286.46.C4]|nr:ribonucleotide reductase large subunit [Vibrio phage 1.121.O._10N.286.46.C4]